MPQQRPCCSAIILLLLPWLLPLVMLGNGSKSHRVGFASAFQTVLSPTHSRMQREARSFGAFTRETRSCRREPSSLAAASSQTDDLEREKEVPDHNSVAGGATGRRDLLRRLGTTAGVLAATLPWAQPARALKPRNEALCGTGFFEHIYEYKCTEIGDIQDEGYSKALSSAETGLTDGLMGKLGLDSSSSDAAATSSGTQDPKNPKTKSVAATQPDDTSS